MEESIPALMNMEVDFGPIIEACTTDSFLGDIKP